MLNPFEIFFYQTVGRLFFSKACLATSQQMGWDNEQDTETGNNFYFTPRKASTHCIGAMSFSEVKRKRTLTDKNLKKNVNEIFSSLHSLSAIQSENTQKNQAWSYSNQSQRNSAWGEVYAHNNITRVELRIVFLEKCLINDVIPNFLRFRIPENGCFEPTIVQKFQRRLLKAELGKARSIFEHAINRLNDARCVLKENCRVLLLPSVILFIRYHRRVTNGEISARHHKKLQELATKQEKPLRNIKNTVRLMCDINLPQYASDLLSFGPKHPIRDNFDDMNFPADMDLLQSQNTDTDTCNDLKAIATWYVKLAKRQSSDRALTKTVAYLKNNGLKAVPFDKGIGYCIMTEDDYLKRREKVFTTPQFVKSNTPLPGTTRNAITIRIEKFKKRLKN